MQRLLQAIAIYFLSTCQVTLALAPLVWQNQSSIDLNTRPMNPVNVFPFCSVVFGRDLSIESCLNAWGKIDPSAHSQTYRPRPRPPLRPAPGTLTLPVRYLSDDGLCSIDLQNTIGMTGDFVSGLLISQQARSIIYECVQDKRRGGNIHDIGNPLLFINVLILCRGCPPMAQCHPTITLNPIPYIVMPHPKNHKALPLFFVLTRSLSRLGPQRGLQITVRRYEPRVHCEPGSRSSPSEAACNQALQIMPANLNTVRFSKRPGDLSRDFTKLPKDYYSGEEDLDPY